MKKLFASVLLGFAFFWSDAWAVNWSSAPPSSVSAGQSYSFGAVHSTSSSTVLVYILKNGTVVSSSSGSYGASTTYTSNDSTAQTITYRAEGWSYNPGSGLDSYITAYTTVTAPNPTVTGITTDIGTVIRPGNVFKPRVSATASIALGSIHIYTGPPDADYNSFTNAQAFVGVSGTSATVDGNPITAGAPGTTYTFYARCETDSPKAYSPSYGPITFTVTNSAPDGFLDTVNYSNGSIIGNGWAADPETGAPVNRVEMYLDGAYKGNATLGGDRQDVANTYGRSDYRYSGYNFSFPYGGVAPGTHTVLARAFDGWGASTDLTKTVTVTNAAPTVSMTINGANATGGATTGTTVNNGSTITIYTSASDSDGNLQKIRVWSNFNGQGWTLIRDIAAASDSFGYTLTAIGTWEIDCRSMDGQNVESGTAVINVTSANRAPDLPVVSDGGVTSVALGSAVNLTGTLRDLDGNLAYHGLWYLPPGGSWTLIPGAPTAPSNATNSTVTGSFTPTSIGTWQFKTAGQDSYSAWSADSILSVSVYDGSSPSVPGGLSATNNTTGTSFTLNWNASTDNVGVTAYEVSRSGTSLGTTASLSMNLSGLTEITTYNMQVRARDAAGNWSAWSSSVPVMTADVTPPSVPAGLSVTANTTGTSFTLNWSASTDNVGVTAYEVMRDATSLGTTAGTSMNVTGLTQGTTYSLKVRGRDAAGNWSVWSTVLSATVADVTGPSAPTGLTLSNNTTGTSFTLSWNASTDNIGVTAYEVMRDAASLGTTASTSMNVVGLTSASTYSMKVRARDAAANWSTWSVVLAATTPDVVAPSVPAGLTGANATESSFTLNWSASTDNVGVTAYEVFRNSVSQGTTSALTMNQTGLAASTSYSMTVRARDAAGNWSAISAAVPVTTGAISDPTPPTIPTGLVASNLTGTGFTLSWTASTDNIGVTVYQVRRDATTLTPDSSASTRTVTGLTPGVTYSFTVRAGDAAGNWSAWSSALSVTPPDTTPPSTPTGLVASAITPVSFTLSWTASTDNGLIVAYEIRRGTTTVTSAATGTSFSITGLWPGTAYSMTVRAKDSAGNWSAWSSALNVTTSSDSDPTNQTQLKIYRPN